MTTRDPLPAPCAAAPGAGRLTASLTALLIAATLSVYWPATGHEFVPYDDPAYVTDNPHVRAGLTLESLHWSLTATDGGNWHPVTWWSHLLDASLFGDWAGGHHLTSILLHAASGALLFRFLAAASGLPWPSLAVAALFALHPLHVESVAWASERKDVLSGFFWMATLCAYLAWVRRPNRLRFTLVAATLALGLMSKPMVVTLPALLLLLDWWPLGRLQPAAGRAWRPLLLEKAPLFLLAVATAIATTQTQTGAYAFRSIAAVPEAFRSVMVGSSAMNALNSYAVYALKALWPSDLAVYYPYPAHALPPWRGVLTALALAPPRALPGHRMALVPGDLAARHRPAAGRVPGAGRPLHLPAAHRSLSRPPLGRAGIGGTAPCGPARPCARLRARARRLGRARLPTTRVLAERADPLRARPRGHRRELPGPPDPRRPAPEPGRRRGRRASPPPGAGASAAVPGGARGARPRPLGPGTTGGSRGRVPRGVARESEEL